MASSSKHLCKTKAQILIRIHPSKFHLPFSEMGISNSWEWFALFDHPLIKVWPEKAGCAESESVCLYLNQKEPNRRKQYVLGDSGEVLLLQSDLSIASIATDFRVHKQEPSTHRRLQLDTRKSFFSKATKVLEKNSIKIPSKIGRGGGCLDDLKIKLISEIFSFPSSH